MTNPNDETRDAILRYLYEVRRKAKSPRSTGVLSTKLQKEMKTRHGYKQGEVASNLDYLVQKDWVRDEAEDRSFTTPRGTKQASKRVTYKLSDTGIDLLEGASTYRRDEHVSRINVTTIAGVTVVGDGNVVNAKLTDLSASLSALEDAVVKSDELSDEERLSVVSDIATIQAQIQKPEPDAGVVRTVWAGIERVVTAGELVALTAAAAEFVRHLG